MKRSIVCEKIRNNEVIMCLKQNFMNPNLTELIGYSGVDCIWLCNEHQAIDRSLLENMTRTAKITGTDIMIRTSFAGNHTDLIQPLEFGAQGLMIPHIRSVEQVRTIVRECKYHPMGMRGMDGVNQDADQGMCPMDEYIKFANENTFIMIQIEDPDALAQVDEIASIPGVDIVFLGPCDYSQSIGRPGDIRHPEVWDAIMRTAEACAKYGKYCGTPGLGDTEYVKKLINNNVKFIAGIADWDILHDGIAAELSRYDHLGFRRRSYNKLHCC